MSFGGAGFRGVAVCLQLKSLPWDDDMVCTKTLYNELEAGNLPLTVFEVPDVLKRRV